MGLVVCPRDRKGEGDSASPVRWVGEEMLDEGVFVNMSRIKAELAT